MADETRDARSPLDQAAADSSITQAPTPARRAKEPTLAEEMDYVGTHDKPAGAAGADTASTEAKTDSSTETPAGDAAGRGATATATKPSRPKTAAEIVAEQRAREKAAAEGAAQSASAKDPGDTAESKTVAKVSAAKTGATGNKAGGKTPVAADGKGRMTSVGSGVKRLRNWIASLIWLAAVIAAAVLALGALFTALDQTNQSNEIVRWVLERGHDLVGPFKDLFRLETAKNTLLVNWGIAALVYLIAGKIVERFVRP